MAKLKVNEFTKQTENIDIANKSSTVIMVPSFLILLFLYRAHL